MRWPSLKREIKASKQILVEGRTPEIFFREWIQALGLTDQIEVRDFGSLSDLTAYLRVFTNLRDFRERVTSLAIIRDAEANSAAAAFESVCASLNAAALDHPPRLAAFSTGTPRIGIYLPPDCPHCGMLETLCWKVLQDDPKLAAHLECVESYLACLRRSAILPNETKTKVWSFLAAQGRFDPLVGRAAQAKIWDWRGPAFAHLTTFLTGI